MNHIKENKLIQSIAKKAFVKYYKIFDSVSVTKTKTGPADVVSQMDTEMDKLLNKEINKAFSNDVVYSEEGSGNLNQMMNEYNRVWVLDPICGSLNVKRGINIAATNVILLVNGEVEAAWVFDYPRRRVIWSVGDKKVYIDKKLASRLGKNSDVRYFEASKGYMHLFEKKYHELYGKFIKDITARKYNYLTNAGSSLTFTYVATGQYDGAVSFYVKSWDILASCFLVEQNGGIVRNFDGTKWGIDSKSVILAGSKPVYKELNLAIKKLGKTAITKLSK